MKTEEIKKEFDDTFANVIELVSSFEDSKFNTKPAENKWSAGQIARHLIKANSGFPQMVSGVSEKTERDPTEMVEKIRADFLDFATPMNAPDFIVPEDENFAKDEQVKELEKIKSEIGKTIENIDLTKTFKAFEFPVYGYLTGLETLAFVNYHAQRHIHQLEKTRRQIENG